jgi:hypothetical protein
MWTGDVDRLIERLELRLEQYRLHADALVRGSRDHEGALALVKRVEARLEGLLEWRKQHSGGDALTVGRPRGDQVAQACVDSATGERTKY